MSTDTISAGGLLGSLLNSDETFFPPEPRSLEETGLASTLVEGLICKYVQAVGSSTGRRIAEEICLPFGVIEDSLRSLRARQVLVHSASAQLNDYYYTLTDQGREFSAGVRDACAYVGPAPVPLDDYLLSVEAQTIRAEAPRRHQLDAAFADISVEPALFDLLGPAVNSGAGLFLYGAPGNGKTTLARRITQCFGQDIWIPRTIIEDGQIIKMYDAAYHESHRAGDTSLLRSEEHDPRWIKIRRPTVVVGGELTMDNLEIRHDPVSNVSEAPLQMKSNCGCLLIDDFGRQRMEPTELLNRWIVPLENRVDFLTIATGKKIQVPFDQLIIFSTNLDPTDLTDDAFLRRIPYKIEVCDPQAAEFHQLFEFLAPKFECEFDPHAVEALVQKHYVERGRALRRCHPRDLLQQIRNYCAYHDRPMEMSEQNFDRVVTSYFTVVAGPSSPATPAPATPPVAPMPAAPPVPPQRACEQAEAVQHTEAVADEPPLKTEQLAGPGDAPGSGDQPSPEQDAVQHTEQIQDASEPQHTEQLVEDQRNPAECDPDHGEAVQHTEPVATPAPPQHTEPAANPAPPQHTEPAANPAPPQHTEPVANPAPPQHTEPVANPAPPQHTEPVDGEARAPSSAGPHTEIIDERPPIATEPTGNPQ